MALLYFVYDVFGQRGYEYTLENGTLSIDVIYGKRYRKNRHELNLQELEVLLRTGMTQWRNTGSRGELYVCPNLIIHLMTMIFRIIQ